MASWAGESGSVMNKTWQVPLTEKYRGRKLDDFMQLDSETPTHLQYSCAVKTQSYTVACLEHDSQDKGTGDSDTQKRKTPVTPAALLHCDTELRFSALDQPDPSAQSDTVRVGE